MGKNNPVGGVRIVRGRGEGIKGFSGQRRKAFYLLTWLGWFFLLAPGSIDAQEDHWKALSVIRLSGHSPPDFTLHSLDGESINLRDLKGKVVLINFWATWCPPCREEMPSMERLYRRLKDDDFTILAVDVMENPKTVKAFARRYQISFLILLDRTGEVAGKYGANAIPTTYIVNKNGEAVGKVIGPRKWDDEHAGALLGELIGE